MEPELEKAIKKNVLKQLAMLPSNTKELLKILEYGRLLVDLKDLKHVLKLLLRSKDIVQLSVDRETGMLVPNDGPIKLSTSFALRFPNMDNFGWKKL